MLDFDPKIGFLVKNCTFSPLEMSRIRKFGPNMFFILLMLLFLMISIYGFYRMAVRSTSEQLNTTSHVTLNTVISPVGVEIAQEEALKSK